MAELEAEEAHLEALVASQPSRRQASPPEGEAPPSEDGEGEGLRGHRTPSGKMRYEL